MGMKRIVLPSIWTRIGSGLIDFLLTAGSFCLVFFAAVYPNAFDGDQYVANQNALKAEYLSSGLYLEAGGDLQDPTAISKDGDEAFSYDTLAKLNRVTVSDGTKEYTFSLVKNLYLFYTGKCADFDIPVMTRSAFESTILRVDDDVSGIGSFLADPPTDTYEIGLAEKDYEVRRKAIDFFLEAYDAAEGAVGGSAAVASLERENATLMRNAVLWAIPTLFGAGFLFEFLIPLFSRNGKTVGKWVTRLVVLDKDGYELKRIWLLPRFLVYIIVEIGGGLASFGATFLISYTMCQFTKKHRALHDYLANSVVADEKTSLWFLDRAEEKDYEERHPELVRE
ncbi:MAG: RDD family protein [Bacilli bacterium]|jgi:uncharacterized RDD family membrane protein YckC|nr:RDD family protein [Bacilli bacterium]